MFPSSGPTPWALLPTKIAREHAPSLPPTYLKRPPQLMAPSLFKAQTTTKPQLSCDNWGLIWAQGTQALIVSFDSYD